MECLNHTLLEKVRAMLHESDLPKFLWAEATAHAVYLKNRTWTRSIGDTTPYELLNRQKPNLGNLHPWGCRVRVHSTGGSKLNAQSSVGRWMGFDAKTKDGHRVYWPERRTVSVERSVKFNFEPDEVVVGALPLEGECGNDEHQNAIDPEAPDVVVETPVPEAEPAVEGGRGKRIRKETEYVRLLKEGVGVVGGKMSGVLPRGMQQGTPTVIGGGSDPEEATEVDYAMAMVIESAEGLTPTYEEACEHPNWPKWKVAIQTELNNLEKSGTWCLVK
jgi:hypothetical protein